MPKAPIKGSLPVCMRGGTLRLGMDEVKSAVRQKTVYGVITASDISKKSLKEIAYCCGREDVPLYSAQMTADEIGAALGKVYAVIGVADRGFMGSMEKSLEKINYSKE